MYNVSMSSEDQLLALINTDNPVILPNGADLSFDVVDFGTPRPHDGSQGSRDTEIDVTGKAGSVIRGTRTVYYNRIPLTEFLSVAPAVLEIDGEVTPESFVAAFNTLYDSALTSVDFADLATALASVAGGVTEATPITISADAASYAYIGDLEITIAPMSIDINEIITQPVLDGLYFFPAPEPEPELEP